MDTTAPPADAKRIRLAAHTAGTCLTPGEQMRVRARFLSIGKTVPLPSVFAKPEPQPHTYTDLAAWTRQMRKIAAAPDAPFRMFRAGGVDYIVAAKYRGAPIRVPRVARARAPRRQPAQSGARTSRGSPSGSDDDPPGLQVGPGTWQPSGVAEPPTDVTTPTKRVTS
jgi:hypothetical protein